MYVARIKTAGKELKRHKEQTHNFYRKDINRKSGISELSS